MAQKDFMEERRAKIVEYINKNQRAEINELVQEMNSTEVTIRRDLIYLSNQDLIIRTHGGAIKKETPSPIWQTTSVSHRLVQHVEEKRRIAKAAAEFISNGESLMIDGGSTTLMLAEELISKKSLLVVTNAPAIGELLVEGEENKVIMTGGELTRGTHAIAGSEALDDISRFYVDKSFIGLTGLIPEVGCFTAVPMEADIKKTMCLHASETFLVVDSSKIGTSAFCKAFDLDLINTIITDSNISDADETKIRSMGIKLVIA